MISTADILLDIVRRIPRENDVIHASLLDALQALKNQPERLAAIWSELAQDILSKPQWLALLFPERYGKSSKLLGSARAIENLRYIPESGIDGIAGARASVDTWIREQSDLSNPQGMMSHLLSELATGNLAAPPFFLLMRRLYTFKDLLYSYVVEQKVKSIQKSIFYQCYLQQHNWDRSYGSGYPYQGMAALGISGGKSTDGRLANYAIDELLGKDDRVLDIGSNCGFWASAVAARVGHVDGIEYNPYLVAIANLANDFLGTRNVSFLTGSFVEFHPGEAAYDAAFSLANHHTIDGNLSLSFEQYIAKIFALLKPGGILFFETHNIFGPGKGGVGDDGDLDAKFDIAERYFRVLRHRMVKAYLPKEFDIDRLFVIMQRRERFDASAVRTLSLAEARLRYSY